MTAYNGVIHWGQRKVVHEHVNGESLKVQKIEVPFTYKGPYKMTALGLMNRAILGKITKEISYTICDANFDSQLLEIRSYAKA